MSGSTAAGHGTSASTTSRSSTACWHMARSASARATWTAAGIAAELDAMICRLLDARLDRRVRTLDDYWFAAARPPVQSVQSAGPSKSAGTITTSATTCIARCSAGAWSIAAATGRGPAISTRPRSTSSTWSAASWARARDAGARHRLRLGRGAQVRCQALRRRRRRRDGLRAAGRAPRANSADGLPIDIRLQDYRGVSGKFDRCSRSACSSTSASRITARFFEFARSCLADDGLFLLHTIGSDESATHHGSLDRQVHLPELDAAVRRADLGRERRPVHHRGLAQLRHRLRPDARCVAGQRGAAPGRMLGEHYDERFRRMWRYYLATSMATFRARRSQLWQIVLSPRGLRGGYVAPR